MRCRLEMHPSLLRVNLTSKDADAVARDAALQARAEAAPLPPSLLLPFV